ncbi:hypothetical protein [Streptomyces sp. NBC_01166]
MGREPAITESLDLIRSKVGVYEDLVDPAGPDDLCTGAAQRVR